MKPYKQAFTRNQEGITSILELVVALSIIFVLLSFFFISLNNFYTVYKRPDIDIQAKTYSVCESLINQPGYTKYFTKNWEDNPMNIRVLGLAASPLAVYGCFNLSPAGKIFTITHNNSIQYNVSGLTRTCFLAGTQVMMGDGTSKNIEDIQVGDIVASFSPLTKTLVPAKIIKVFHHTAEEMGSYYLVINHWLKVTPDHSIYINNSWRTFGTLHVGDNLYSCRIFSIEKIYRKEPTYNLEVEGTHTYLIRFTHDPLVVHNDNYDINLTQLTNIDWNPWVPVRKEIYPENTYFETYGSAYQSRYQPWGYIWILREAVGETYSEYFVEYTLYDGNNKYLYEVKETTHYPHIVLDYEKCDALHSLSYDWVQSFYGLQTPETFYDINISITSGTSIVSRYGPSYQHSFLTTSVTRNVLIYYKPTPIDDTFTANPPRYEKGQITVRIFLRGGGSIFGSGALPPSLPMGNNQPPPQPALPLGAPDPPNKGYIGSPYTFQTQTVDPEGDQVQYGWDWNGDLVIDDDWTGFYDSGETCTMTHSWDTPGEYIVSVKARDNQSNESDWTEVSTIHVYFGEYYKNITIQKIQVAGGSDLLNFPVLISIPSDTDLRDYVSKSDGGDIVFTDISGVKLAHEIEYFSITTGELAAWVNVPVVSSSVDTQLYMYYNNGNCTNQENTSGVWDSNYHGVWHLNEGSGTLSESTSYGNNGTAYNNPTYQVPGKIAGAMQFDGSDDYVSCGDPADGSLDFGTGDFTVECWVKPMKDQTTFIVSKHLPPNLSPNGYGYALEVNNKVMKVTLADGSVRNLGNGVKIITDKAWHHLAVVFDRDKNGTYYVDGNIDHTIGIDKWAGSINTEDSFLLARKQVIPAMYFNGVIDEVRVSAGTRTGGWITTGYNNVIDPGKFFVVGAPGLAPPPSP
ncbi:MAG: DUF2341 domain-containing protein [Methanobacteriota archaeon]